MDLREDLSADIFQRRTSFGHGYSMDINPLLNFGFHSSMKTCRDGPTFHECTEVTKYGGNRRNGKPNEKRVITKVKCNIVLEPLQIL